MIGVYVHVPYCQTLCPYCDFVRTRTDGPVPRAYADALCREIAAFEGPDEARSVFLGGGTPSLLSPTVLERIFLAIRDRFHLVDAEVTIEANPDDVTEELADAWTQLGVNRVSLGVQSFDDSCLQYLGRRHDAAGARRACEIVAERFENWSLDLILGVPPWDAWPVTLDECLRFAPKHVSVYGLTHDPGTPFEARAHECVDDDTYLRMYREAHNRLAAYDHYEVSNFAKPGYACRHNLIYWRNEEYAGFGPGAFSYIDGVRAANSANVEEYLAQHLRLTPREIRTETLIQHFRLAAGITEEAYQQRFGSAMRDDFGPALDDLIARGLIEEKAGRYRPTYQGYELNNEIGLALVGE